MNEKRKTNNTELVPSPGTIVKVTKKRQKAVMLPELQDRIYTPNRVTNMDYDYSMIQERILNWVLFYLQDAIQGSMNGKDYTQLKLFNEDDRESILINIPLSYISTPQQYPRVRESAKLLAGILIAIPRNDSKLKEKRIRDQGLFSSVDSPEKGQRSSFLTIELKKEVARLLVEIDFNKNGKPMNYTSFIFQIVMRAKNKYTSRIYKRISSWKEKGGFYISIEEFRNWLRLGTKYKHISDLKRFVLQPVQEELEGKADCWFNCSADDFVQKRGSKITGLHFKVITPAFDEKVDRNIEMTKHLLAQHHNFTKDHLIQLNPLFEKRELFATSEIFEKIIYVSDTITKKRSEGDPVNDPRAYMISSLTREFVAN